LVKVLNEGIVPVQGREKKEEGEVLVSDVSVKSKHARALTSARVECLPVSELFERVKKCKLIKVLNAGIVPVSMVREERGVRDVSLKSKHARLCIECFTSKRIVVKSKNR